MATRNDEADGNGSEDVASARVPVLPPPVPRMDAAPALPLASQQAHSRAHRSSQAATNLPPDGTPMCVQATNAAAALPGMVASGGIVGAVPAVDVIPVAYAAPPTQVQHVMAMQQAMGSTTASIAANSVPRGTAVVPVMVQSLQLPHTTQPPALFQQPQQQHQPQQQQQQHQPPSQQQPQRAAQSVSQAAVAGTPVVLAVAPPTVDAASRSATAPALVLAPPASMAVSVSQGGFVSQVLVSGAAVLSSNMRPTVSTVRGRKRLAEWPVANPQLHQVRSADNGNNDNDSGSGSGGRSGSSSGSGSGSGVSSAGASTRRHGERRSGSKRRRLRVRLPRVRLCRDVASLKWHEVPQLYHEYVVPWLECEERCA